jgi:hypothetical protein
VLNSFLKCRMPKGQNLFVCSTYPKTKNSISFDHFTFTSSSFDIGPRAHLSICCALHPTMPLSLGRAMLLRPAVSLLRPVRAAAIPAEQGFRTSFPSKIPVGIFGLAKLSTGPKTDSHPSDCSPCQLEGLVGPDPPSQRPPLAPSKWHLQSQQELPGCSG